MVCVSRTERNGTIMTMTNEKQQHDDGPSGQDLVEQLKASGQLDALFEQIDAGQVELTGDGGFVPALVKAALERGLQAELSSHLGYEKGSGEASKHANSRNGSTPKTVQAEFGPVELEIPRDRAGSFTPRLVPKGQRRLGGLDDMIISLYAGGMTGPTPVPWTRGLFTLRARVYRSRRVRRRSGAGSGTRSGGAWCCSGSASGTSFDGRTARR